MHSQRKIPHAVCKSRGHVSRFVADSADILAVILEALCVATNLTRRRGIWSGGGACRAGRFQNRNELSEGRGALAAPDAGKVGPNRVLLSACCNWNETIPRLGSSRSTPHHRGPRPSAAFAR